jgi:hypothetical protein
MSRYGAPIPVFFRHSAAVLNCPIYHRGGKIISRSFLFSSHSTEKIYDIDLAAAAAGLQDINYLTNKNKKNALHLMLLEWGFGM